ncbi:MAG: single-stranded DNA-binding protein [Verrucomicrobiota bacterium]|nr:single-stranded DNA-binding protein [Verrucomicrobiota bacterium]
MASFNKVILMGNLTRDPELRVTPAGLSICKFGLAVNRVYNSADGERKEEVTFVDIDSFGKQAETISKYLTKGRPVLIEGRLKLDQWEDKNSGEKRSKLGVVAESFQFVGAREGGSADGSGSGGNYDDVSPPPRTARPAQPAPQRSAPPPPPPRAAPKGGEQSMEDDVPF